MEAGELQDRIAAFTSWQYEFELGEGVVTPVADRGLVNRQWQRRGYFFEALLTVCGGSLVGRRVLDLGCGAGFWSLQAVEAGAEFVLGVDGREMYVEQAGLVFEAKGVERSRYRFERANIFEHGFDEHYDIVLCLGLLNVVSKPVALFELMAGVGAELIVIDTGLARFPYDLFELSRLVDSRNAIDYDMALVPTRQAVVGLASQFGFDTVALAHNITDYARMDDYRDERRLAFICSKGIALSALPQATRPPVNPWLAALARLAGRARRRAPA